MLERLQKIIAHAGIASRRHAEQLILSGQVLVNGQIVRELGSKADPEVDKIEAAGRTVEIAERKSVYLIMHKPSEVVSTLADPEGRKTLRNFLRGFPERVYPVGNLDYAGSGLIFLTNDGTLTDKMLKSWSNIPQVYHIKVKGRLNLDELDALGLKTGTIVRVIRQPDSTRGHAMNFWYEAQVTGSKLDILALALLKDQHPIEKVKRIGLGPLSLEGIPVGKYILLKKAQVEALNNPTHPPAFAPHPRPKPVAKTAQRPAPSRQAHRHPSSLGKAQHFSGPFSRPDSRPARYTKFQRRPSTPPNTSENFDEFEEQRPDTNDTPRAPWLTTSRPAAPAEDSSAKIRGGRKHDPRSKPFRPDSKSFRPKGPRKFSSTGNPNRPPHPAGKFNRSGSSPRKFNRRGNAPDSFNHPSHTSGKPQRRGSGRPKSERNFSPRKPRSPR